ncbi:MAG TPA: SRPBCC family protein, partial [Myxococcota bacterium]
QWQQWSPYEKLDANLQRTYTGAPAGVGATYAYAGDKAGAGSMTITSSTPTAIDITLIFERPMKATNLTVFTFTPAGDSTVVVWKMSGENSLMAKVAGLFLNMDALIGGDFERGLADLKTVAER